MEGRCGVMEEAMNAILICLFLMLVFKDMSGKDELRRIREELEKMNRKNGADNG